MGAVLFHGLKNCQLSCLHASSPITGHESFTCEVSPQAQGSVDFSSSPVWQQDCSGIFLLFKNTGLQAENGKPFQCVL